MGELLIEKEIDDFFEEVQREAVQQKASEVPQNDKKELPMSLIAAKKRQAQMPASAKNVAESVVTAQRKPGQRLPVRLQQALAEGAPAPTHKTGRHHHHSHS
jgi:hypothetical protein